MSLSDNFEARRSSSGVETELREKQCCKLYLLKYKIQNLFNRGKRKLKKRKFRLNYLGQGPKEWSPIIYRFTGLKEVLFLAAVKSWIYRILLYVLWSCLYIVILIKAPLADEMVANYILFYF